jgi:UDP-3-O-[3-hydroxymyristoyl] glucosamine N-acyltransferase
MGLGMSVPLELSLDDLISKFKCTLFTEANTSSHLTYFGLTPLSHGSKEFLGFLANEKYLNEASTSAVGALICSQSHASSLIETWKLQNADVAITNRPLLLVSPNPYATFARVAQYFHRPDHGKVLGHSEKASIDVTAHVHADAILFPFCFVGAGARVGAGSVLYSGVFVGAASSIGNDCILYPNAVVREGCRLGDRVILNPCAVIGGDGFGFAPDGNENVKIPQVGGVTLADDVEIGSNTSVDRGAMNDTKIGSHSKLDSLVQVAHNVELGKSCFVAGLSGIAGSTKIGNRVTIAGQVGVGGHIQICDNVTVLAKAGVSKSVTLPGVYNGYPLLPNRQHWQQTVALKKFIGALLSQRKKETTKETSTESDS